MEAAADRDRDMKSEAHDKSSGTSAKSTAEPRVVEHYAPLPDELPPPTFRQALVGYGSIILALVLLGVLLGVLMRVLR
jgi:hypothetical protein